MCVCVQVCEVFNGVYQRAATYSFFLPLGVSLACKKYSSVHITSVKQLVFRHSWKSLRPSKRSLVASADTMDLAFWSGPGSGCSPV